MEIHKAYKTELAPTNKQATKFIQHCNCARFAWNWGLALVKDRKSKPNAMELHKLLNSKKREEFSFMYEVSKCAPHEALRDLEKAFKNFFAKRSGFPKFKSKHAGVGSFRLNGSIHVKVNKIKLPRIGWVRLKEAEYIPLKPHILSVTVSGKAGRWFASINVVEGTEITKPSGGILGIDLGIKTLATCSDGTLYPNPRSLYKLEKTVKKLQKQLAGKKRGSNRRKKCKIRLSKLYTKITNVRKDATHKLTSEIVKTKQTQIIVLENLNVAGMVKNHKLAKAISDANMREIRGQIEYKSLWAGIEVVFVDRFFPSSKLCSSCGSIKDDLKLSDRMYACDCGLEIDRDLNAAYNLKNTASLAGINARGDGKVTEELALQWPSEKRELNIDPSKVGSSKFWGTES